MLPAHMGRNPSPKALSEVNMWGDLRCPGKRAGTDLREWSCNHPSLSTLRTQAGNGFPTSALISAGSPTSFLRWSPGSHLICTRKMGILRPEGPGNTDPEHVFKFKRCLHLKNVLSELKNRQYSSTTNKYAGWRVMNKMYHEHHAECGRWLGNTEKHLHFCFPSFYCER